MRSLLTGLVVLILTACSQAPVKPAPAAAAQAAPPPQACPAPAPAPVLAPIPAMQEVPVDQDHREVLIQTNFGDINVQLDAARAPHSVKSFLTYVSEHFYDDSGFYRVIPGFVIQGGDYTPELKYHRPKHPSVQNESGNGLSNQRGSIALARDNDPDSANATFYINLVDNRKLDPRPDRWGYAVFGQVVAGMDVVDKIAAVPTGVVMLDNPSHDTFNDVPKQPVKILKVTLLPLSSAGKP